MQEIRETLQISFDITLPRYRRIWLEEMRAALPNIIIFWGVAFLLTLFVSFLFPDTQFFTWFSLLILSIPFLMTLSGYKNYIDRCKRTIAAYSEDELHVSIKFQTNENWFEITNGENYSRVSWSSIKSVVEKKGYFILNMGTNPFPIPKDAFRSESDMKLLRMIISTNVAENVRLLN